MNLKIAGYRLKIYKNNDSLPIVWDVSEQVNIGKPRTLFSHRFGVLAKSRDRVRTRAIATI